MNYMVLLVLFAVSIQVASCTSASDIVEEARRHIGSTTWSYLSTYGTGWRTNKCNQFVYDVLENVGADPPRRRSWWRRYTPIGAGEWGNPRSSYLIDNDCYTLCGVQWIYWSPGDVISNGGHVAIVTDSLNRLTISASSIEQRVVENDWGFSHPEIITACWRYTC